MQLKKTFTDKNKERFPTFRRIPQLLKTLFITFSKLFKTLFVTFPSSITASSKIRKRAGSALKVLLVLIVISAVSYGAFDYYASILLKREYNVIRQQGEPLFFSEVALNKVPDSENAALLYIKAAQELKLPKGYEFQRDAPQQLKILAIQDNQQVMRLVERASLLTQSHFPVQSSGPPDNWVDMKLGGMSSLARFIQINALENARRGNYTKAFQQIGYIDQLAARTANGDTLIGFLVARYIQSIEIKATYTLLQNAQLTKEQAQSYFRLLSYSDWHQVFYNNMLGERTFNVSSYEYLVSDIWNRRVDEGLDWDDDDSPSFKHRGFLTRPLLKMSEVYSLRLWQKVLLQAKEPGAIDANYETKMQNKIDQLPFYASDAKETQEIYLRSFDNRDRAEVSQRQQKIAIALNAYKTEHGKYPETLAKAEQFWGAKFPLDPYTNKPFHYRVKNHEYVLYSVGQNRIDDGGIKSTKNTPLFDRKDLIWGDYPKIENKKEETK